MPIRPQLKPEILKYLSDKTGLKKSSIRSNISKLRRDYASCTLNAVAQLYARSHNLSVLQKLDQEDKACLPHVEIEKQTVKIPKNQSRQKEKIINCISYETNDHFKKGHINEINRAYTNKCYTSVFILARKIVENLIIDIMCKKFPPNSLSNRELYFDNQRKRFKDFSVILKNFYDKRNEFDADKIEIIKRLYDKALALKDDANQKTHSWYHLVERKKEIDDLNLQAIIELIKKIEE